MRIKKSLFILLSTILFIISGCSSLNEPPDAIATVNDKDIEISKGSYHWEEKGIFSNKAVVADAAAPHQIAEQLETKIVDQGSVVNIKFSDNSKPQLNAYLWGSEKRGKELSLKENHLTLPSEAGTYAIEVMAKWSNGDASYTFVVETQ
jgi:hypothetical protein